MKSRVVRCIVPTHVGLPHLAELTSWRPCTNFWVYIPASASIIIKYHGDSHITSVRRGKAIKDWHCPAKLDIPLSTVARMIFDGASLSAFVLCIFVSLNGVSALPSPFDYPDVVPGPGLPSLVSLGLTSKDLYEGKVEISNQ